MRSAWTPRPRSWPIAGAWAAIGVVLLVTSSVRWVSSGSGSSFAGLELADVLRSSAFVPDIGDVVAVLIYLVVASGGLFVATSVVDHAAVVVLRGALCLGGLGGFVFVVAAQRFPVDRWGVGAVLALFAYTAGLVLTTVHVLAGRTIRRG